MIDKNMQIAIMNEALEKYGVEPQMNQLAEECAELNISVNKLRRKGLFKLSDIDFKKLIKSSSSLDIKVINNFYSELADVEIMVQQMKLMINNELFEEIKSNNLEELHLRLKGNK